MRNNFHASPHPTEGPVITRVPSNPDIISASPDLPARYGRVILALIGLAVPLAPQAAPAAASSSTAIPAPANLSQVAIIRSQVSEGLRLVAQAKKKIESYYARRGVAPADRAAAGLSPNSSDTAGKYVTGMDVSDGVISVSYGNQANPVIAGQILALTPLRSVDGHISWQCGGAPQPGNLSPIGGSGVTTISNEYLPAPCGSSNVLPVPVQVSEGFRLVDSAKTAVVRYFRTHEVAPNDRAQAGLSPNASDTAGNYVSEVGIDNGVVNITYGNLATSPISGAILALTPYKSPDGSPTWQCGIAPPPPNTTLLSGAVGSTTVASQHLPPSCVHPALVPVKQQILEGLRLATALKAKVGRYFQATGTMPADRTAAGLSPSATDTSGYYVSSVEMQGGGITIVFNSPNVHLHIAQNTLGLTPYLSPSGDLIWICGNASLPIGAVSPPGGSPGVTSFSVPSEKFLPLSCQTGGPSAPISVQINEGLQLASKLQNRVANIYAVQGTLANANDGQLGLPLAGDTSGSYVSSITVAGGGITISYAQPNANALIQSGTLGLTPYVSGDGKIAWVCGNAQVPSGLSTPNGATSGVTTLPDQYLPVDCRP